jgi:hypothetical protein
MILGGVASALAAAWKFVRAGEPPTKEAGLDTLYTLGRWIRMADEESKLSDIEHEIDRVLQSQRIKATMGDENAIDVTTLNVAAHRLENLVHDRRVVLIARQNHKTNA